MEAVAAVNKEVVGTEEQAPSPWGNINSAWNHCHLPTVTVEVLVQI